MDDFNDEPLSSIDNGRALARRDTEVHFPITMCLTVSRKRRAARVFAQSVPRVFTGDIRRSAAQDAPAKTVIYGVAEQALDGRARGVFEAESPKVMTLRVGLEGSEVRSPHHRDAAQAEGIRGGRVCLSTGGRD